MAEMSSAASLTRDPLTIAPPPVELEREPLVANGHGVGWLSDTIAGVAEGTPPTWWKICFAISATIPCMSPGTPSATAIRSQQGGRRPMAVVSARSASARPASARRSIGLNRPDIIGFVTLIGPVSGLLQTRKRGGLGERTGLLHAEQQPDGNADDARQENLRPVTNQRAPVEMAGPAMAGLGARVEVRGKPGPYARR